MRRKSQSYIDAIQSKKIIIAIALLTCFTFLTLLSEVFILAHVNHEHDNVGTHESCSVCTQIQSAENTLKQLGTAVSAGFVILAWIAILILIVKATCHVTIVLSPVTSKIRLNN